MSRVRVKLLLVVVVGASRVRVKLLLVVVVGEQG